MLGVKLSYSVPLMFVVMLHCHKEQNTSRIKTQSTLVLGNGTNWRLSDEVRERNIFAGAIGRKKEN